MKFSFGDRVRVLPGCGSTSGLMGVVVGVGNNGVFVVCDGETYELPYKNEELELANSPAPAPEAQHFI